MENENFKKAYENAKWLCSKSEKCSGDMFLYLGKYEISNNEKEDIIAKLTEEKYIDDERYTIAFVSDKFKFNKWGKIKLSYELKQKRIKTEFIEAAIAEIDEKEYLQTIKTLILQRDIEASSDYEYNQKTLRYMLGKGFEPDLVEEVLKTIKSTQKQINSKK